MHTFVRRLAPALVLPLAVAGLAPNAAAAAESTADSTPSTAEVAHALATAPSSLVLDTSPVSQVSPQAVVSGAVSVPRDPGRLVQLGTAEGGLAVGVPGTADPSVVRDGVSIFQDDDSQAAYVVNPLTAGGAQLLVTIGGPESSEKYAFPVDVPAGAKLRLTEDGGAEVMRGDGALLASIPTPWARDATGRTIPTRFMLEDGALVQVVQHRTTAPVYPVLADPSLVLCDAWTATCVKFSKTETAAIAKFASPGIVGALVFAQAVCNKIPHGVIALGCAAYLAVYAYLLDRSFDSAAATGRCVELHFSRIGAPLWWKTESC